MVVKNLALLKIYRGDNSDNSDNSDKYKLYSRGKYLCKYKKL
jgi:hypothetical protein